MKKNLLLITTLLISILSIAQSQEIRLFPNNQTTPHRTDEISDTNGSYVGNRIVTRIKNVSTPTIKIYKTKTSLNSKSAILVCPGGGYNILAYDLEGEEVCQWLNKLGITAILLKYRVPRFPNQAKHIAPLEDAQRAIQYIRSHANELNLDPNKIGIMGFSAGAHLSVMTATTPTSNSINGTDISSIPNFCLLIYPAYLDGKNFQLADEIKVTSQTPPTFIVQTQDDKPFINSSLFYYYALKQNGVSATMHLYDHGGHGYGLRNTGAPVNRWPQQAYLWLKQLEVIH